MKQKELSNRLDTLLEDLRKANNLQDKEKINKHVASLNKLWEEASKEMLKNAQKEGFIPPKKD